MPAQGQVIRGWAGIDIGGRGNFRVVQKVDFDEGLSRVDEETPAMY
jgi:hypothetical protein